MAGRKLMKFGMERYAMCDLQSHNSLLPTLAKKQRDGC
jgi:hypothetical protein